MEEIKITKGFKPALAGKPDLSRIHLPDPETVGVSVMDIPYIRPRILVKENDPVRTGTPLFCDKRNQRIQYVSPATGSVQNIIFGDRRRLKEIVIRLEKKDDFIQFETLSRDTLEKIQKSNLIRLLQEGGLWPCFRQFPFKDTADPDHEPAMIIVSMNGNDPFSPHPAAVLENEAAAFEFGIRVLHQLTSRIVISSRQSSLDRLNGFKTHITHKISDVYPFWDPGVVLYRLKTSSRENQSWCISAEHLTLIGKFLLLGIYPVKRVFTVTRSNDQKPHIIARQGSPIATLAGSLPDQSIITTGRFNGRQVDLDSHMGFFETTLNIIQNNSKEELFGFITPGISKPSASRTFLSSFFKTRTEQDCNLHGEERACVNCGYCAKICPVDLDPSFIMKAILSDDIEDALSFGLLDCCRCGLCSYACPSKIELTHLLSDGINAYYKDKQ